VGGGGLCGLLGFRTMFRCVYLDHFTSCVWSVWWLVWLLLLLLLLLWLPLPLSSAVSSLCSVFPCWCFCLCCHCLGICNRGTVFGFALLLLLSVLLLLVHCSEHRSEHGSGHLVFFLHSRPSSQPGEHRRAPPGQQHVLGAGWQILGSGCHNPKGRCGHRILPPAIPHQPFGPWHPLLQWRAPHMGPRPKSIHYFSKEA
jgi:hypothetical protein